MARCERLVRRAAPAAALAVLALAPAARATTYYVDSSCAYNGNGLADSCATGSGGAGRFNDLHACDTTLVAGDTCSIRPGDYYRNIAPEGGRRDLKTAFHPVNSGTASAPITYKAYDAANPPRICSAPNCSTVECDFTNSAIGVDGGSAGTRYIVFDGLRIIGNMTLWGDDSRAQYITVKNVEISGGWTYSNQACGGSDWDGNWSGLRIERADHVTVRNVYIHDVMRPALDRGNGVKLYDTDDSLFESMTIYNTMYSGIEIKDSCTNNEFRYNRLINVAQTPGEGAFRGANQNPPNGGNDIHHNVIVCGSDDAEAAGYYIPTTMSAAPEMFHHNTVYRCANGHKMGENATNTMANVRDNIFQITGPATSWSTVIGYYTPSCSGCGYTALDYNAYTVPRWRVNTSADGGRNFTDLASWRSFWSGKGNGFEAHSQVLDCQLASPGRTLSSDFHVRNAACKTLSSTGGPIGAYENDGACIGYGCSSAPPPNTNPGTVLNNRRADLH